MKTSFAPGSPTAERYLGAPACWRICEAVGFGIVGYGCTTCIGNSGPLSPRMQEAIASRGVHPVAVLSGNRNFPGRVHPQIEAGFLASPPLVVAYALAGDVNRDILTEPIGQTPRSRPFASPIFGRAATRSMPRSRLPPIRPTTATAYEAAEASDVWQQARRAGDAASFRGTPPRPTSAARPSRRPGRRRASAITSPIR